MENTVELNISKKFEFIPDSWEITNLGSVTKVYDGTHLTPKYVKKGIPFYSVEHISKNDFSNTKFISEEVFIKENERVKIEKGDILMTRIGDVGTAKLIDWDVSASFYVSLALIKSNSKFNSNFLEQFINSGLFQSELYKRMIHVAFPIKINLGEISKCLVIIPPKHEQIKISEILSNWDMAINKTQNLIQQLELRKIGLMQELLTGKKRLPGFDGGWREEKLGDYFKERKDTGYTNLPLLSIGKNGVYPQDNSEKKDTSNSNKSKYKRICPGDIGYNTMRMWQGRSALSEIEGIVSPAYTILKPNENTNSLYFSYLFKLEDMVHKFYRNSQGMVSDTWMCKYKDLSIIKFQAPSSFPEQKAIADILKIADEEIEKVKRNVGFLKLQKKGLMQQLLTGKKRINF